MNFTPSYFVISLKLCFLGHDLPYGVSSGAAMNQNPDGKGLHLTYDKNVFSFICQSKTQCYWVKERFELQISRRNHMMINVPSSLLDNCGCELNSLGDCRCKPGVTGPRCNQCQVGYWGIRGLDVEGCISKKFSSLIKKRQ